MTKDTPNMAKQMSLKLGLKHGLRSCLLAAGLLAANAGAQAPFDPKVCYQRCTTIAFEDPDSINDDFREKIQAIQSKKDGETDPEKRKALEKAELADMEKLKESLGKTCSRICKYRD